MFGIGSAKALIPNQVSGVLQHMVDKTKMDAPMLRAAIAEAMTAKGHPCDANSARVTEAIKEIGLKGFGTGKNKSGPEVEAWWTTAPEYNRMAVLGLAAAWLKG